jgi:hypothetical protein
LSEHEGTQLNAEFALFFNPDYALEKTQGKSNVLE